MSGPFLDRPTRLLLLDRLDRAVAAARARPGDADDVIAPGVSRRAFLAALARTSGTALAAAYGASLLAACGSPGPDAAQSLIRSQARRNETVERWLFRHTAMDHARATARDAGASFPTYHVAPAVPVWDAAARGPWALQVTGRVARPLRLTLAELAALPGVTQRVNHYCVEGWNAVATWRGVRVADLARLAGADPAARYVDFRSFDVDDQDGRAYHECWDVESATHPQTIVAYAIDGRPLDAAHGAPARVHSPVKLGYKNTKYLTEVVFRTDRTGGYWSDRGYEWYGGT